jgi:type IV fimbrial biogenesis protein FimT
MTRADAMGTGDRLLCDGNSDCSTFGRTRSLVMGHDRNGDQRLSKMEVLRKLQLTGKVILVWKRFRGTFLGYEANGNSRFQNGSFYICNDVAARRIVMNWIGRPRIEAATPGDCD